MAIAFQTAAARRAVDRRARADRSARRATFDERRAPGIGRAKRSAMSPSWMLPLFGGAAIGVAAAFLWLTHGRIAGISGVLGALLPPLAPPGQRAWRLAFLLGLAASGAVAAAVAPHAIGASTRSPLLVVTAGLLVGVGTRWGSGCTSGHGICGVSRLAPRSLVAVATFMLTGALAAALTGGAS